MSPRPCKRGDKGRDGKTAADFKHLQPLYSLGEALFRVRSRWAFLLALLGCVLLPDMVAAQAHCQSDVDTSDAALAARFAPVLRFAPSEPYFPTIPYFYAFDGLDNNENGLIDFEDLDEIAAYGQGDSVHSSWDVLDQWYVEEMIKLSPDVEKHAPIPPLPAVFYRVRALSDEERDAIWRYLKKDILDWNRAANTKWRSLNLQEKPFKVIEYYFFYVRDTGLVGHPLDIEFTFVFVPSDPALACEFRVVAGAGHTERVPNNTLVVDNRPVLGNYNIARDDTLTGVLTELGGHSSAPDLPPYGIFMLGVDVNWQSPKTWGTRDVQSLARMGYGGEYRPEMTLPRDSFYHPVVLWPEGTQEEDGVGYSLVPAPLFEQLAKILPDDSSELTPEEWVAKIDTVTALVDSIGGLLGQKHLFGLEFLDSTRVRRMAAWNRSMIASQGGLEGGLLKPHRVHVWQHSYYTGSTDLIFKSHLFPPSLKSLERPRDIFSLISWGFSTWPGTGSQLEAGLVVPWFEVPILVRGFFELQAGVGTGAGFEGSEFSLGLTYYNSYFQFVSWYSTITWLPDPEVTGSHFTFSAGPSLLLWMKSDKSLLGPINILRFSTGPRFRLASSNSTGVDWEFALSFRQ